MSTRQKKFNSLASELKKNKLFKVFIAIFIIVSIFAFSLLFIDKIKITVGNEIRFISLNRDELSWEDDNSFTCYDENITYMPDKDISITNYGYKEVGIFRYNKLTFEKGNLCDLEFYISEKDFLDMITKGEVIENEDKLDLVEMIKGKEAIVGNTRYNWEDDYKYIELKVGKDSKEIYVTERDGLLVIQIGNSDEGPKYIAYK